MAEHLFGEHGVENVSLRQIRLAAGQRNAAAVQYHFGDRDGVLRALAERHTARIAELTPARPTDGAVLDGLDDRALVELLLRPIPDYVAQGPSARSWTKVLADRVAHPQLGYETMREGTPEETMALAMALYRRLAARMPPAVAGSRLLAVSQFSIQQSAARASLLDSPSPARVIVEHEAFVQDLVDLCTGALFAPVHPAAAEAYASLTLIDPGEPAPG